MVKFHYKTRNRCSVLNEQRHDHINQRQALFSRDGFDRKDATQIVISAYYSASTKETYRSLLEFLNHKVQMYGNSSIFEGPTALLHHELQSVQFRFLLVAIAIVPKLNR